MQSSLVSSLVCETASADAVLLNPADRKVPWACSYDMPRFSRASFGFEARAADGKGRLTPAILTMQPEISLSPALSVCQYCSVSHTNRASL